MVITCEACSTRFNLNESLLKAEGSKVRCCRCKQIFTAYPPAEKESVSTPSDAIFEQSPEITQKPPSEETTNLPPENALDTPKDLELDLDLNLDLDLSLDLQEDDFSMDTQEVELNHQEDDDLVLSNQDLSLDGENELTFDEDFKLDGGDDLELDSDLPDFEENDFTLEEDSFEIELENPDSENDQLEIQFEDDFTLEVDDPLEDSLEIDGILEDSLELELGENLEFNEFQESGGLEEKATDDLDFSELEVVLDEEASIDADDEFDLELDLNVPLDEYEDKTLKISDKISLEKELDFTEFEQVLEKEDVPEDKSTEDLVLESELTLETADEPDAAPNDETAYETMDDTLEEEPEEFLEAPVDEKPEKEIIEAEQKTIDPVPRLQDLALSLEPLPPKKKRGKVSKTVLTLLLLTLLLAGGYSVTIMQGIKLPYLSEISIPDLSKIKIPYLDRFLKKPVIEEPQLNLTPDKKSVNGRFVTNSQAGTLFVITGEITNHSTVPCNKIQVIGTLITMDKVKASKKTVYAGNIISEKELSSLEMTRLDAQLTRPTGSNNSNTNIPGGRSIPFMIVFSNLPDNLENFTVKVAGFEAANKK